MPAQSRPVMALSLLAMAAVPYARFVALSGAPSPLPGMPGAVPVTTAGAKALAVSGRPALFGEAFDGIALGSAVVEAGGAITAGAEVASDAQGCAVAQSGTAKTAGIALEAATAAGELIEVLLTP